MTNLVYPTLPGLTPKIMRQPEWKTDVIEAWNGRETAIGRRSFPRWRYTLSYEVLRSYGAVQERAQLMGFFNMHRGQFDSFLYVDEEDNAVMDQPFGTTDGITKSFQLCRSIDSWVEPVWAPTGAPTIKRGSTTLTAGLDYSIGPTGIVTLTNAGVGGDSLTWTGSYAMRVRFASDVIGFEKFLQGFWQVGSIVLLSKVFP